MYRVMLDLETMGNKPGAAIISIGAVFFDEREGLGAEFHVRVDLEDSIKCGLRMDASTVKWWMNQPKEAQQAVMRPGRNLVDALRGFADWLRISATTSETEVWGNGSDFDSVLLAAAFDAAGIPVPWKFYRNRCYRTLKNLPGCPGQPTRVSMQHDALEDAKYQARHACDILNWLRA